MSALELVMIKTSSVHTLIFYILDHVYTRSQAVVYPSGRPNRVAMPADGLFMIMRLCMPLLVERNKILCLAKDLIHVDIFCDLILDGLDLHFIRRVDARDHLLDLFGRRKRIFAYGY